MLYITTRLELWDVPDDRENREICANYNSHICPVSITGSLPPIPVVIPGAEPTATIYLLTPQMFAWCSQRVQKARGLAISGKIDPEAIAEVDRRFKAIQDAAKGMSMDKEEVKRLLKTPQSLPGVPFTPDVLTPATAQAPAAHAPPTPHERADDAQPQPAARPAKPGTQPDLFALPAATSLPT